ncbi:virion structural protein [Pectobacterium phage vB_PcaM_CBB]|uniref:Structural protein n=1 Tax=Pectobacterium phage vB_PcaM_CBB TaxID=2772511 RepID=A0A1L2CVN5_9CAUD|nr:virion structural protein [Pectobacterium phage vB_PcaM_CBB]AMM44057.1 structural protein [Pectobacterium phage vB_PcaM_CBB]
MQVEFKNALFGLEDYDFAVVSGDTLIIALKTREIHLEFESEEEAFDAKSELAVVIEAAKADSISITDVLEEAASVVTGLFGGLVSSVKAKATKASSTVEARAAKVVADLEEVLDTVARSKAEPRNTAKDSADAESVFGTTRTARNSAADTVVSELSDNALRVAISDKADHLVENDTRVKALVAQLRTFHSDEEVDDVIQQHKDQIFRIARANDHLTVNEVFVELLRGL